MFVIGYLPLELVVSAAWKSENYEPLLVNLKLALNDLEIGGDLDVIKSTIDTETTWLAQRVQGPERQIGIADAARASQRLAGRIFSLWQAARHRELTVKFDQLPYYSVFISYSTADEEFCRKLYDALSDSGLRLWFAPDDVRPAARSSSRSPPRSRSTTSCCLCCRTPACKASGSRPSSTRLSSVSWQRSRRFYSRSASSRMNGSGHGRRSMQTRDVTWPGRSAILHSRHVRVGG